ncbi:protein XRI1-like [Musa acuminata AAA Group]|uniref:protein XRI1-like n=1 Tax=Musa acuminata AAA Group TaxID=214697 RepID=UPI0031D17DCC
MRGETSGSVMARLPLKPNFSGEIWEWQGVEYCLPRHSQNEFSHLFWDEVSQNEDHLFCNLNEHTPIKKCSNLGHQITDVRDATTKGLEECREPLQLKRRRTLQFTSDSTEVMECSMVEDGVSKSLECSTLGFSDDRSAFNCGGLDQSSDEWLADCLNDGEIQCSPDEMKNIVVFQLVDVTEYYHNSPSMETDMVPETPAPVHLNVFQGKKSYVKIPRKLNTSIAYPFALIEPCGVHSDVTLNDINQRIHAAPPSRLKHKKHEDPSLFNPTSAFSGKPVIVKTKVRTEGGQCSITVMRTKG